MSGVLDSVATRDPRFSGAEVAENCFISWKDKENRRYYAVPPVFVLIKFGFLNQGKNFLISVKVF